MFLDPKIESSWKIDNNLDSGKKSHKNMEELN